jgi:hypothetical protein
VLWNATRPAEEVVEQYRRQKAEFVALDPADASWGPRRIYAADLLEASGGIVRHDPGKLAGLIRRIVEEDNRNENPKSEIRNPKSQK